MEPLRMRELSEAEQVLASHKRSIDRSMARTRFDPGAALDRIEQKRRASDRWRRLAAVCVVVVGAMGFAAVWASTRGQSTSTTTQVGVVNEPSWSVEEIQRNETASEWCVEVKVASRVETACT